MCLCKIELENYAIIMLLLILKVLCYYYVAIIRIVLHNILLKWIAAK